MNNKEVLEILGLSREEKKILRALSSGPQSISNIARTANIPRTSLLYILRKLETRHMVERKRVGKRPQWYSTFEESLTVLKKENHPGITTFHGVKNIFSIFEEVSRLPANTRVCGIQPNKSLHTAIRKNDFSKLLKLNESIKNNKLIMESIVHEKSVSKVVATLGPDNAKKIFRSFVGRLEDYSKIPDDFADVEAEIYIFKGKTYLINWNKEIAIGIEDPDMTDLLLAMFSCVKHVATKYSQNEKMKDYLKA